MSDSDDDEPLGNRAAATSNAPAKEPTKQDAKPASLAPRPRQQPIVDSDDSDDDLLFSRKPAAKPKPAAKAAAKPALKPQSAAERVLTKNESLVKREVEQEQAAEQKAERKQAAAKERKAAAHKSPGTAASAKPRGKAAASKAAATSESEGGKVKKERKLYEMPGQTKETPSEIDPLRKFYTSLRAQRPDSEMARKWLVQHGLLSQREAEEFVAEQKEARIAGRPVKSSPTKPRAAESASRPRPKPKAGMPSPASRDSSGGGAGAGLKRKAGATQASGSGGKLPPVGKKKLPPALKRRRKDDAFTDGGLAAGSDSDDDVPLAARAGNKA